MPMVIVIHNVFFIVHKFIKLIMSTASLILLSKSNTQTEQLIESFQPHKKLSPCPRMTEPKTDPRRPTLNLQPGEDRGTKQVIKQKKATTRRLPTKSTFKTLSYFPISSTFTDKAKPVLLHVECIFFLL